MTTFLFWNIRQRPLTNAIVGLVRENDVDIIILAESKLIGNELVSALNRDAHRIYSEPLQFSLRLQFFSRYPLGYLEPLFDDAYLSIRRLRPPIGVDILIAAIHLPSKLYRGPDFHAHMARKTMASISAKESELGLFRTIVIGDFNMDPYEAGMTDADAFHAVMDKKIARRPPRTFMGCVYPYFYNPMWSGLGDESPGPPGTYFYDSGNLTNPYWHTLDQVLVRPGLLDFLNPGGVRVLTTTGDNLLLEGDRVSSDYSDHLPVLLELDLEKGI